MILWHFTFMAIHINYAPVSYLRSLVVRAVHRHRTGVGSIPGSKINAVPRVGIRGVGSIKGLAGHQRTCLQGHFWIRKRAPKDQVDPICLLS